MLVTGGHVARELVRFGVDRMPLRRSLPRHLRDVDAALLSRVLGRRVDAVEQLGGTDGTTARGRYRLKGDDLPGTVFVKMAASAAVPRFFANVASLGANEVRFYRDVRPALDLEAPMVHGVDHDVVTGRFVLVLEDLEARGCTFGDAREAWDVDRAAAALETLAAVHSVAAPNWVRTNSGDPMLPLVSRSLGPLARKVAKTDPGLVPPGAAGILSGYTALARRLDQGPQTLLHGDPHPGNVYVTDGRVGLLDWQVVRRGHPLRDVTYLLVLALSPETRRAHERSLLDHYSALNPGLVDSWRTYRQMAAYPYVAMTFTAGLGGLQPDSVAREGLRRAVAAIEDLETVQALHG